MFPRESGFVGLLDAVADFGEVSAEGGDLGVEGVLFGAD